MLWTNFWIKTILHLVREFEIKLIFAIIAYVLKYYSSYDSFYKITLANLLWL